MMPLSDRLCMEAITELLGGHFNDKETREAIAVIVRASGRRIREAGESEPDPSVVSVVQERMLK